MSGIDASRIVRRGDRLAQAREVAALSRVALARRLASDGHLGWGAAAAFATGAALPDGLDGIDGRDRFALLAADAFLRLDPNMLALLDALGVGEADADTIFGVTS